MIEVTVYSRLFLYNTFHICNKKNGEVVRLHRFSIMIDYCLPAAIKR